jgi:hypothetical protein
MSIPFPLLGNDSVNISWQRIEATIELLKLKSIYGRQSVGKSVLVSGTHLGHAANFSFSFVIL